MTLPKKVKDLAAEWYTTKQQLDELKIKELELRNQLVGMAFSKGLEKGTNKQDLDNGYVLKAVGTVNYKVDEAAMPIVIKSIKERFKFDASACIRTKLELSESNYNKLPEEIKKVFDEAITSKPGTPQVEIVKPKR